MHGTTSVVFFCLLLIPLAYPPRADICLIILFLPCCLSGFPLVENLPKNHWLCVCVFPPGVPSGVRNVRPCGKDADREGPVPGGAHSVFAAEEPQGHRQALRGRHGEVHRGLWLSGARKLTTPRPDLFTRALTFTIAGAMERNPVGRWENK